MKLPIYNLKRESVGEIELDDAVFAAPVKEALLYEVVKAQLASRRSGTKATKERSAVSGSSAANSVASTARTSSSGGWLMRPPAASGAARKCPPA